MADAVNEGAVPARATQPSAPLARPRPEPNVPRHRFGVAYLILALAPVWWLAPFAVTLIGLGFYMLHNTAQTNATQMSPEARGTAVGLFSAALYLGQTAGVATFAPMIDRFGAPTVFIVAAVLLPALGLWFAGRLRGRAAQI